MAQPSWTLTEKAKRDLQHIAVYTVEAWGLAQGDDYIEGLYALLDRLSELPRMGQAAEELPGALRTIRYRSHILFYDIEDQGIRVIRILHTSQNPDAAFPHPDTL